MPTAMSSHYERIQLAPQVRPSDRRSGRVSDSDRVLVGCDTTPKATDGVADSLTLG